MKREWLTELPELLIKNGITQVVVSPGSRNAPLLIHLSSHSGIKLYEQVDERSAGFLALGMAQYTGEPVALVCTSGSAVLNYGPALAEAFYQRIPLLILTADRPPEWIDQADGQTIRQQFVFQNYIRKSFQLPVDINHPDEAWFIHRSLTEAIQCTLKPVPGPVHINIPLREPLYELEAESLYNGRNSRIMPSKRTLEDESVQILSRIWQKAQKVMVIAGLHFPTSELLDCLYSLSEKTEVAVLTDIVSNLYHPNFLRAADDMIEIIQDKPNYMPDILITFGGPVISKKLKTWLRLHQPREHWHISDSFESPDTFQCLTKIIPSGVKDFIKQLNMFPAKLDSNYSQSWHSLSASIQRFQKNYFTHCVFSDFKACNIVCTIIPNHSVLHFANSMPVRYAQFFDWPKNNFIYSNRGVSGIDGCVSTATGSAYASHKLTTLITGDLSMLYDAHALWNDPMPENLRIIVFNNGGGGIFNIIKGPDKFPQYQKVFTTPHSLKMNNLAEMHHIEYMSAKNEPEVYSALKKMYEESSSTILLEIITNDIVNEQIYKDYFLQLKNECYDQNMD